MPFLRHWINGSTAGVVELAGDFTIGRSAANNLKIDDGTVSSEHAVIKQRGELYTICDLDSTNGVFLNGKKINEHTFAEGDVVMIGTHELEFLHRLPDDFSKTLKIKKSWIPGVYYTE